MFLKTLAGRCIHQGLDGTKVQQNLTYRWLTLDSDAIQTLINRRHPERSGLQYVPSLSLAARAVPGPSCLLGLGGAGVAHALAPCLCDFPLDAVESSHEVIEIAARFFMTGAIKNLNIIHQDAFLHVQRTQMRYQHLMVDLFGAHSFPEHCNNADFFRLCQRVLLPGGILAVNLANAHEQWPVSMLIREHFRLRTVCIPVNGIANMVVLACNGKSIKPLLSLIENHPRLKQLYWDSDWGYIARGHWTNLSHGSRA